MGLLNSTSSIYWKGNWGPERKCVFILVTHSYLVAKSKLENGLLTPNPVLLYDHVLLPLSPTICPTLLQWQARLYPLPTTKLCRATIQMAFSVYTEKLKDCSLKKKKIHCLCILKTHTHAHTKTWDYMILLELLFGSMFPGRMAKRIKTLMWSDAEIFKSIHCP